ncbi:MAG: cyclic nucleotide-binding domain-containing protein [Polyangiaceae bacterium]
MSSAVSRSSAPPAPHVLEAAGDPVLASLSQADRAALAAYLEECSYDAGCVVLNEDDDDRTMYFVLSGKAAISRRGLAVGDVRRGQHFGELALVADRPRAATVTAITELRVATLSPAGYDTLTREQPELALRVLSALFDGVADRLVEMTDSVSALLRERSLPRRTGVDVVVRGERTRVRTGTPAEALLSTALGDDLVVAALVDRKAVSLSTPLTSDCALEPLLLSHWEGQRVYRRSQALALLEAAYRVEPELGLSLSNSVGFAQRVRLPNGSAGELLPLARRLESQLAALVREDAALREELWTVDEARAFFSAAGWSDVARLLDIWRLPAVPLVSFGKVYALRLGPMLSRTSLLGSGLAVLPDDEGLLMVYGKAVPAADGEAVHSVRPAISEDQVQQARQVSRQTHAMTRDQDRWLATLGITSIGSFNHACIRGDVSQLIRVSEGFQEKSIGRIADEIQARGSDVRVVCIAGPSSSGKTTFISRLAVQLQVNGIHPVGLSLDDYYVDREDTPKDENGEYDYEDVDALRVDLLQDHLERLLQGETVRTARYDFALGASQPAGGPELTLGAQNLLLLEGIHGINPRLLSRLPEASVFRVFACPLAQLPFDRLSRVHASDVRLLRRIVRDRHTRGATAAMNLARWPSVRRGERKHIFPFQHYADAVFDSSLIYELSVLKVFAERYLLEVPQSDPSYATAFRLLGLLDHFVTIYPDHVPPTSILREFIGRGFSH